MYFSAPPRAVTRNSKEVAGSRTNTVKNTVTSTDANTKAMKKKAACPAVVFSAEVTGAARAVAYDCIFLFLYF